MRCASCNHDNAVGRRFCTECGATLSAACLSCGNDQGLLAPVYGWFTEGFDTRALTDAKKLLDELKQP